MRFAAMEKGKSMKNNNLNPCPRCGCKEIITEINYPGRLLRIHCDECPTSVELDFEDADLGDGSYMSFEEITGAINEAIDRWNRRNRKRND